MSNSIEIINLHKQFDELIAVDNIDLTTSGKATVNNYDVIRQPIMVLVCFDLAMILISTWAFNRMKL